MQVGCENGPDRRRDSTQPPDAGGPDGFADRFQIDAHFVRIASGATRIDVRRAEFWPLMELMSAAALRLAELQADER